LGPALSPRSPSSSCPIASSLINLRLATVAEPFPIGSVINPHPKHFVKPRWAQGCSLLLLPLRTPTPQQDERLEDAAL
ncbi:unnamed protein product, partial [Gulo gulo]